VDQRLSLVTLGVADLERAVAFYSALGWTPDNDWRAQDVAFFQGVGGAIALWSRAELAADSGVDSDPGGWGGITPAYNARTREEVDAVIEEARAAGARIVREPAETFWGGYSACFADPDDHRWEVAHNPGWTIAEDGAVTI
jgi:catechol 2,3-dioxygenase-like lactoylglutathione lyase family enzyme